jgi:hypothetical protein
MSDHLGPEVVRAWWGALRPYLIPCNLVYAAVAVATVVSLAAGLLT